MSDKPTGQYRTATGHELPYVDFGGVPRVLAALPPRPNFGAIPRFAEHVPVIPRQEWRPVRNRWRKVKTLDQGSHSSCVGNGGTGATMTARAIAGMRPQLLSASFPYAQINGGRDAGAVISDCLEVLMTMGTCLESEAPEGAIFKQQIPKSAYETAKRFRVSKAYHAGTFDEIVSGIILGFVAVYGIYVGGDFANLDKDGIAPAHPGRTGNHCMYGDGYELIGGRHTVDNHNSWGSAFGEDGRCRLVEEHYDEPGGPDAFLVQVVLDDPMEADPQPVAIP